MNCIRVSSLRWFLLLFAVCLMFACELPRQRSAGRTEFAETIPLAAGVEHFSSPAGESATWVSFIVGKEFSRALPEAIEKVSVSVNGERLPLAINDFTYFPGRRLFWAALPGTPAIGEYVLAVTGQHCTGSATDRLDSLVAIGPPTPDGASPDSTLPCSTNRPVFTWSAATANVPLYYRLEIAPAKGRPIYRSGDVRAMLAVRIPDGVLQPGKAYRWRVRSADSNQWQKIQNRSQTPWIAFTTARRFAYEYRMPENTGDGILPGNLLASEINPKPLAALCDRIINREIENIHSLLLVKDGKLVFEEYFYGYEKDKKHMLASVTKSVVSLLVGISIDRGFIPGGDAPVVDYFPEYISASNMAAWKPIRLHHLLTMSAGLDWDAMSYPREDPRQTSHQMYDSPDPMAFVFERKSVAKPGRVYNYNSGLTLLLGEIVRRATGLSADRFAGEYLFDALGVADFYWDRFENGVIAADGGLFLRPRDMAKIGMLVLNKGSYDDRQVVSESWVAQSTRSHIAGSGVGYGYQWRRTDAMLAGRTIDVIYASGLGGQRIFILPEHDAVAVVTSKVHHNYGGGLRAERLLLYGVLPALLNIEIEDKKIVALTADRMKMLVGRYESGTTGHIGSVILDNGRLFLQVPGRGSSELFFTGPDECFGRMEGLGEFSIRVVAGNGGLVDHARFMRGLKSHRLDKVE